MAANGSILCPLLSHYDLKFVCGQCCVSEREITYQLKSVQHQCAKELLLCRAKCGQAWRPVARRPIFPSPFRYVVCHFFRENFGCLRHKNRCTFARSEEEAAVWTIEKQHGLDHSSLSYLLAQTARSSGSSAQPSKSESLEALLQTVDLKAVCHLCSSKKDKITYTVHSIRHVCDENLLLAKVKQSNFWRPVGERPKFGNFGRNVIYQVCRYFTEDTECLVHGEQCTYARSFEEATVWNFVRDQKIDNRALIKAFRRSEPVVATPEGVAEDIVQRFSGEFIELCKECFDCKPLKLTEKRWNSTCSADAAHSWDPVFVYHLSESHGKEIYQHVRPLPEKCTFTYCSYVTDGKPCWHEAGKCLCAHSEVEMAVWIAEKSHLSVRAYLLKLSTKQPANRKPVSMYCKVCLVTLSSPESFFKHCSSLGHAQLLLEDTTTRWRCRSPPHNNRADFWLCDRPRSCEYGKLCTKAHSEEELKEWVMRAEEEKDIRHNIEVQGLMNYNEKLLEEYRHSSNEVYIISEQVDDVNVKCDTDLTVECEDTGIELQWKFQVDTERQLVHVALLKEEPGASFSLCEFDSEPCIYLPGEDFQGENTPFDITVSFKSENLGLYEQWLVMDFGMRPVLLRKLRVRVGPPSAVYGETLDDNCDLSSAFQTVQRWHRGNRVIIPCFTTTEEQVEMFEKYKPPQINILYKPKCNSKLPLNEENYSARMHSFLYDEEQAEYQVVSRLNLSTKAHVEVSKGLNGECIYTTSISCTGNLTPETSEGLALRRSIKSALIALTSSNNGPSKVYHVSVSQNRNTTEVCLQLSQKCVSDLGLEAKKFYQMEVQFQLDRLYFCVMHKAIDRLPDLKRVLPDLKNCAVPVNVSGGRNHSLNLNAKQQSAMDFITGDLNVRRFVAPLLIYGPFGTGKTSTLGIAARELTKQPQNKVLICTYTNSSADLYVRDHLHPFINKDPKTIRLLRIKADSERARAATDEVTLKYCFLSPNKQFLQPTRTILDCHNIIITTTSMARHFYKLSLPEGYFTHILIDEAAQMLECEALLALGLAGPNTRVVLAGDHMQMAPTLFSVDAQHRSNNTLLTRLFHYYQNQRCDAALRSRIIFSENYRSTKDIVDFVATHFYEVNEDVIKAVGDVPAHPTDHSLIFHHVRGKCRLDKSSMSWYNTEEVAKVVETLKGILDHWPSVWKKKDPSSICVLSEGVQVKHLRSALKKKNIRDVHVENIANVQGRQFRVIVITAVQTRDSLKTAHVTGFELLSDARVLNTAMTRAQSQLVVVGDAAALSCFGACSKVWKSYISHCIDNNSALPQHYTYDFFERDIKETVKLQPAKRDIEEKIDDDEILQQMRDEFEQEETECALEIETSDNRTTTDIGWSSHVTNVKHGQFIRESLKHGYVMPSDSPGKHIRLSGHKAFGKAFNGDEVLVDVQENKVTRIIRENKASRVLMCYLEDIDHSKPKRITSSSSVLRHMIPLTKKAPKICILLSKKTRNFLPVWEKIDERWTVTASVPLDFHLENTHVFEVQVIGWKKDCYFPLGNVISVIPVGTSPEDGIVLLKKEFNISSPTEQAWRSELVLTDKDAALRRDLCELITFTVDPENAVNLDDAISVANFDNKYELGIHIADVASFVGQGSTLEDRARQLGATYYAEIAEPTHMFPAEFSKERLSLLPGQDRRVVSLIFSVTKETNQIIGAPRFQLSLINSKRQLSYTEAHEIISSSYVQKELCFDTVEDCVRVAYCFAKAQRRRRLEREWAYSQAEEGHIPGQRKGHLMIEELSVLFNKCASEQLISGDKTHNLTPLRCQEKPCPEKLRELSTRCGDLIPLSFHMQGKVDSDNQDIPNQNTNSFSILTKVWNDILTAARGDDMDSVADLVAADDIHPQLMSVVSQFKKCCRKAYMIRSKSSPQAEIGHYSLNVTSYTQASSPIRRFIDIVLQRLLHSLISDGTVQYSTKDIDVLCSEFEQQSQSAREFERKAEKHSYAVSMKTQNAAKTVVIVGAEPTGDGFAVSFPFTRNAFAENLSVMYSDLQVEDQPLYDESLHCFSLRWKRRIYSAKAVQIQQELMLSQELGPCTEIPLEIWKAISEAIVTESWDEAKALIEEANAKTLVREIYQPKYVDPADTKTGANTDTPNKNTNHYAELDFQFQLGDTLQIQMTSQLNRHLHLPVIQLVQIKPKFEICVDHVHNPTQSFTRPPTHPPQLHYSDTDTYKRIWRPLCEMESATSAVHDSESITIEDLVVNFHQGHDRVLTGNLVLKQAWIKEWAIACNLAKCLLCIRKRGLQPLSRVEHRTPVDPTEFTWVAHATTTNLKAPNKTETIVEFSVRHLPMEKIPECVFQKATHFTVEIIPKLLPDIRKDEAVLNIDSACALVQNIALGQHISNEALQYRVQRWELIREGPPGNLPQLNQSQYNAVEKALNNSFTLIQGPPGTGKTVVGVTIVHWFFKVNQRCSRRNLRRKDKTKRDVILYCGPSNKSVDVVAEFLMQQLEAENGLRPLRVYSQQVEMLDYPFPDCELLISKKSTPQDRSKTELRRITLHHRMRMDQNPYSAQIKDFDLRIDLALNNKGPELTKDEVTEYRKLLTDARLHELIQHDVILCTCAVSSSPTLTKNVSARQILIDESAMATEPQALIPLVCNNPEKIVLIGDHKQLSPIVKNLEVRKKGMATSLFERYFTDQHTQKTARLKIQYRMHKDICEFPSQEYYDGELETGVTPPESVLCVQRKPTAIVFGDICGKTISQIVKTAKGNEKSKANREERDKAIHVAEMLVRGAKVEEQNIVILSPYNAQVSEIREELRRQNLAGIPVTTITKSQGSEWRYVIISTVCSLPREEIQENPDCTWLSQHLGFVGYASQINVGITRAKEGLCIIGNQKLLSCSTAWKNLLSHYTKHGVVTEADKISVNSR